MIRIDNARNQATFATVMALVGIADAATGVVLYVRMEATTITAYSPDRNAVGMIVAGTF